MTAASTAFAILDIDNPLVAWLAYRGEMVSSGEAHPRALSIWLTRYLKTGATNLRAELELEAARIAHHPEAVSRLRGFYLFADAVSASRAIQSWGGSFRPETVVEVATSPESRISRHDAEWITHELTAADASWMGPYVRGEPRGSDPIWELVVDGRALILGTDVRAAAYEVVKATWPRSLPLLELARVGVELGSDLGLIAAMIMATEGGVSVNYAMDFIDATNSVFLKRFAEFDGPRNTADLSGESDLVLPDLRDQAFALGG